MPRGGYQAPRQPAPVSGPGSLSRRTDGKQPMRDLPNAAYGEQATNREQQRGADMAASNPLAGPAAPPEQVNTIGLGEPTQHPDRPVTDGADAGAGAGLAALGLTDPEARADSEDIEYMRRYMPYLEWRASRPGASPGLRQFVRRLKASM